MFILRIVDYTLFVPKDLHMQSNILKCSALLFVFVLTNTMHGGDRRICNKHGMRHKYSFYKQYTYGEQEIKALNNEAEEGCTLAMQSLCHYFSKKCEGVLSKSDKRNAFASYSVEQLLWSLNKTVTLRIKAFIYKTENDRFSVKSTIEELEEKPKSLFNESRNSVITGCHVRVFKDKSYDEVQLKALRWVHKYIETGTMKFTDLNHLLDESRIPKALNKEYKLLKLTCATCNKTPPAPPTRLWNVCGRCGVPSYCSPGCQKSHWPTHKPSCKAVKKG